MDRGIPTEDSLAKMRSIGASYLVGTPKGRLTKLERSFLGQSWARVREVSGKPTAFLIDYWSVL